MVIELCGYERDQEEAWNEYVHRSSDARHCHLNAWRRVIERSYGHRGLYLQASENGKIKGDEISFTVTREFNGNKRTMKYNGKITADAIKGKTEFERNGEAQSRDWEAKRASEAK